MALPVKPETDRIMGLSRGAQLRKQDRLPPPTGPKIPVGCFAPPLTDEAIERYHQLIQAVKDDELREAMEACMDCVKLWWSLPVSKDEPGQPITVLHRGKETSFREVPLQDDHVEQLWDVTPWLREVDAMKVLFERISPTSQKELRDAAHHLLWHVQELALYREPLTSDVLKS